MIQLVLAALAAGADLPAAPLGSDTLRIRALAADPVLDGIGSDREYGTPTVVLDAGSGRVRLWVGHRDGKLFVAADVPDSTYYWGDDVVVSLDADGSGGGAPGAGDRAWIIRRAADSSVVHTAAGDGRWEPAGGAPPIGTAREGPGWAVRTTAGTAGWTMEMRLDLPLRADGRAPRIALRTFNDRPALTWATWPVPPSGVPVQRLERVPDYWLPLAVEAIPVPPRAP